MLNPKAAATGMVIWCVGVVGIVLHCANLAVAQQTGQSRADGDEAMRKLHADSIRQIEEAKRKADELRGKTGPDDGNSPKAIEPLSTRYKVDPILLEAWKQLGDTKGRKRDKIVGLLEDFATSNPDSPLLPEVYYTMGSLYLNDRYEQLGETRDASRAEAYFTRAHQGYGRRWDTKNDVAWSYLVRLPGSTAGDRLAYFEWLVDLEKNGTEGNIYPYRQIGSAIGGAATLEWSKAEKEKKLASLKGNIRCFVDGAWKALTEEARRDELLALLKAYPDRPLSAIAKRRLGRIEEEMKDSVGYATSLPPLDSNSVTLDNTAAGLGDGQAPAPRNSGGSAGAERSFMERHSGSMLGWVLGGLGVLGAATAIVRMRRRQRQSSLSARPEARGRALGSVPATKR